MKPISFLGDSLARLQDFPDDARSDAGYQLNQVQIGNDPDDWKPIRTIGPGVREIRIGEVSGDISRRGPGSAGISEEDVGDTARQHRSGNDPPAGMEARVMDVQTFDNVFDAIADTPAEAANLTARAELLAALNARVRGWNLSQQIAADRLGVTRPRLNDLLQGKLSKFSLDALVNLATASGLTVHIRVADAA